MTADSQMKGGEFSVRQEKEGEAVQEEEEGEKGNESVEAHSEKIDGLEIHSLIFS
jgi:hypothetical protein